MRGRLRRIRIGGYVLLLRLGEMIIGVRVVEISHLTTPQTQALTETIAPKVLLYETRLGHLGCDTNVV